MTSREAFSFVVHELERNTNYTKDSTFGKAVDMLNDLVERDTPKKPLLVEVSADNEHHYVCLCCNATINIGHSKGYNKVFNVFCRECGQRLDWSDK